MTLLGAFALMPAMAGAATLPEAQFMLPNTQGQESIYGVEFMWGYYCPLEWVDEDAEHSVQMVAPDGETYTYRFYPAIQDNAPGEGEGGSASAEPYPNGLMIRNFFNPETYSIWATKGYYTFTIPANIVYVTVDGEQLPNTEAELTYYCSGSGSEFFEEDLIRVIEPTSNVVEKFSNVVVQFPTTPDSDGWSAQLLCDTEKVPVELAFDGTPAGMVYGTISTEKTHPNRVTIDMSEFTADGEYQLTFIEGIVYQADGKKNRQVTFTLYLKGDDSGVSAVETDNEPDIYFDLNGRPVMNPAHGLYIHNGKLILLPQ